uniref:WSN domain-containing protein n=1 Tax=Caenorhabditis tropicalis TaxID=1561998 RepID=A0A1I7TQE8_9PELO
MKYLFDKTSIIARISNGISLQSGLLNGSIPIHSAIEELLGLDSNSNRSIFQSDQMTFLVSKLKSMSKPVDSSIKNLETTVISLNNLRIQSESAGKLPTVPVVSDYLKFVKEHKLIDYTDVLEAYQSLSKLKDLLNDIETLEMNDDATLTEKKAAFSSYFYSFEDKINLVNEKLPKVLANAELKSLPKEFLESRATFSPINGMIDLVRARLKVNVKIDQNAVGGIKDSFKQVEDLKSLIDPFVRDISSLKKIKENRLYPNMNQKTHTRGFLKGIFDISQLKSDLSSQWIESISNRTVSSEKLEKSLAPLFLLEELLKKADEQFDLIPIDSVLQSNRLLFEIQSRLKNTSLDSTQLTSFLYNMEEACLSKAKAVDVSTLQESETLVGIILEMGEKFENLKNLVTKTDINQLKNEMDEVMKLANFTNPGDKDQSAKELPTILKSMKNNEKFKKLKKK